MSSQEFRKLQQVGEGTFSITLPKRWIVEKGLKRGDLLAIVEEPDGSLRLQPPSTAPKEIVATINAELCASPGQLARLVVGCYNQGYDAVRIVSSSGITQKQVEEVVKIIDRLPGFEMVEQTYRRIVIQSFVDPSKFPIEGLLKRLQVMITVMLNNVIELMRGEKDEELINSVKQQEEKIDELYFLIIRLILLYLRRRELGKPLGVDSPVYAAGARTIAKTLEEMADYLSDISEEFIYMKKHELKLDSEAVESLKNVAENVQSLFGKAMKALFSQDILLADEVIEQVNRSFRTHREDLNSFTSIKDPRLTASIRYILWALGYVARGCKVIAEVTYNRFVRLSTQICSLEPVGR